MAEIVMPRLSDTMEEGTILSWLVADGEPVKRGQELVEIETDKANMTYESDQEGILETVAAEGDTLPVGAPIARVGDTGAKTAAASAVSASEAPAAESTTITQEPRASTPAPQADPTLKDSSPAAGDAAVAPDNERASPRRTTSTCTCSPAAALAGGSSRPT